MGWGGFGMEGPCWVEEGASSLAREKWQETGQHILRMSNSGSWRVKACSGPPAQGHLLFPPKAMVALASHPPVWFRPRPSPVPPQPLLPPVRTLIPTLTRQPALPAWAWAHWPPGRGHRPAEPREVPSHGVEGTQPWCSRVTPPGQWFRSSNVG